MFRTYALTQNGEVYSWGINYNGSLGLGNNENITTPIKLNFLDNAVIKKIYIGERHAFAVDTCSKIYSWGTGQNYQLCNGHNQNRYSPSIADLLNDFNIDKIICSDNSTIILADNKLYSIGYNNCGELGLNIKETERITLIKDGVEKVWGNNSPVFCKMCNGDIYAWGTNHCGQLGIGNTTRQNTPVRLNIDLDIKSIYYNNDVTYAFLTNGDIYTWGHNNLVSLDYIPKPTRFTYFIDNDIQVKSINRNKSARKID